MRTLQGPVLVNVVTYLAITEKWLVNSIVPNRKVMWIPSLRERCATCPAKTGCGPTGLGDFSCDVIACPRLLS